MKSLQEKELVHISGGGRAFWHGFYCTLNVIALVGAIGALPVSAGASGVAVGVAFGGLVGCVANSPKVARQSR